MTRRSCLCRVAAGPLGIDLDAADETHHGTDGIHQFGAGVEIRSNHRGRFIDTAQTIAGSGGTKTSEDCSQYRQCDAALETGYFVFDRGIHCLGVRLVFMILG